MSHRDKKQSHAKKTLRNRAKSFRVENKQS